MSTTVVSAPGKVLLFGGYLVLDQRYSGLVVATSSRFYSVVRSSRTVPACSIRVRSPQFLEAEWTYEINVVEKIPMVSQSNNGPSNKFIQLAIDRTLRLVSELKGIAYLKSKLEDGLDVIIVGDNDFYSQRSKLDSLGLPRTVASLGKLEPFSYTNSNLAEVHKTGLGSSAALTCSLITSLLLHLGCILAEDIVGISKDTEGLILAHNLSQYVHCYAQGKIGSGFDVSSAIFGSHVYRRFKPDVIEPLMKVEGTTDLSAILSPDNTAWDGLRIKFQLPPLLRLVLADIDSGSDTPSLVSKVLRWRRDREDESERLWSSLNQNNQALVDLLRELYDLHSSNPASYRSAFQMASIVAQSQWDGATASPAERSVLQVLFKLRTKAQSVRKSMKEMGDLADVPIEPPEQTALLDACVSTRGVVCGGVPGAGGYDAVWLLILDPEESAVMAAIENVWSLSSHLQITPMTACESVGGGVEVVDASEVPGLSRLLL